MEPFASQLSTWPLLAGRYRVLNLIGRGGMGAVFEAEHTVVKRRVAIKLLLPDLAADEAAVKRFRREAQAAGQLNSDHVVAVTDFGIEEGIPFLVMDLLRGETLAARLARRQRLSPVAAITFLRQACRGVQHAHEAGVVHCDIKPRNLFVVRNDAGHEQIRLLDFGIARLLDDAENCGLRLLGTPSYMSPEQASGDAPIDFRTDVYALGVVLYELLSGSLPHPGHDSHAVRCQIARDPPIPLDSVCPELPTELVEVVHRALARLPTDRHPSVAAFERDLARHELVEVPDLDGETAPLSVTHPTPIPTRSHWKRSLTIGVAAAGVSVLGWSLFAPRPPEQQQGNSRPAEARATSAAESPSLRGEPTAHPGSTGEPKPMRAGPEQQPGRLVRDRELVPTRKPPAAPDVATQPSSAPTPLAEERSVIPRQRVVPLDRESPY